MEKLSLSALRALLLEFMDERGRIPTAVDDGTSGLVARLISPQHEHDERLMQTAAGLWRWMLVTLRVRQAA